MAARYVKKDAIDLAWLDNRDQIKLGIHKIVRRLENEVFGAIATEFDAAIARGKILELRLGEAEIITLLNKYAARLALEGS